MLRLRAGWIVTKAVIMKVAWVQKSVEIECTTFTTLLIHAEVKVVGA